MKTSAKVFVYGLILSTMVAFLPQSASATQDVVRGDSYANVLFNPPAAFTETGLVPGGILKFYVNTAGAFGCSGTAQTPDTVTQIKVQFTKSASSIGFPSIIDTVDIYVDANNNQQFDAGDVTLVGTQSTPDSPASQTSDYTIPVTNPALGRVLFTGAESYVIVLSTKNNLLLADTVLAVRIPNRGVTIVIDTAGPTLTLRPNPGQRDLDTLVFKVYNDSTGRVFQGNKFIHQDSGVSGQKPFTLFQGTIQGETRTVGGDSLTEFGVNMGGSAGSNVDSAYVIVGSNNIRVDLVRTVGTTSWNAVNITTVPLALAGGLDTFRVVVTVDTPPLQSFVGCTIPIDSVNTKFRFGNPSVIDSSGVVTFTRPRAALTDSTLPSIIVHPDSRPGATTMPVLLAQGTIQQDTLLSPILGGDSVQVFGFKLIFDSGMRFADIESVGVSFSGVGTIYPATLFQPMAGLADSYMTATVNQSFGQSCTYAIGINFRETALVNSGVRASISIDSVTFRYRATGPSDSVVGSRYVQIGRPRIALADSILPSIAVHPDTLVQDSFIAAVISIQPDSIGIVTLDTLTRIGARFIFGGGFDSGMIDTVIFNVNGRNHPSGGQIFQDSIYFVSGFADTFTTGCSVTLYVKTNNFAVINGTLRAQFLTDSFSSQFRVTGPGDTLTVSRIVTINKPRIDVADSVLPSISVHPDTLITDSFIAAVFSIQPDTLLTPRLTLDTITKFGVRFIFGGGMDSGEIDTVIFRINSRNYPSGFQPFQDSSYSVSGISETFTTGCSVTVYVRTNNFAPINGTLRAQILIDSINSRFRVNGPADTRTAARIVTINKPRVAVVDSSLPSIAVHPDSRITSDSFIAGVFSIQPDTLLSPPLALDTITKLGVRFIFGGGFDSSHIDTVVFAINTRSYAPGFQPLEDSSYSVTLSGTQSETFTTGCSVTVYVKTRSNAPINGTLRMQVLVDSITTRFRVAGPGDTLTVNRIVTMNKPRIAISDSAMVSIFVHPDSRIHGNGDSLFVASFNINQDTLLTPPLAYDTITAVRVRLLGSSLNSLLDTFAHFDTVIMVLGSSSYVVSNTTGGDSYLFLPNQTITGTTAIRVYVRIKNILPAGCTLQVQIPTNGVSSIFRDTGAFAAVTGSRTDTFLKPRFALFESALPGRFVHPDTRVQRDSFLVAQGAVVADTFGVLGYDTITQFKFRFRFGPLGDSTRIDTVITVLNGQSYVLASKAGDSFVVYPTAQTLTGTTTYQIYIRTNQNMRDTIQFVVDQNALTSIFRDSGPSDTIAAARIDTFFRQQVITLMTSLGAATAHPDSRVSGIDTILVCSGVIRPDTSGALTADSDALQLFGIRISQGGSNVNGIDSVGIVINGETFTAVNTSADSWQVTPNRTITNGANFRVVITFRDTTYTEGVSDTVFVTVPLDSVVTLFRDSGPASDTHSSRIFTETKPILGIIPRFLAVPGIDTINPILAFSTPQTVFGGVYRIDSSLIIPNFDTNRQIQVRFGGTARDSVYNTAMQFNIGGPIIPFTKIGTDTWLSPTLDTKIISGDTFTIRINLADSTTIGTTLSAFVTIFGDTATFSTQGYGQLSPPGPSGESSGLFTISADPITLGMWTLRDTQIPPWEILFNPTLVDTDVFPIADSFSGMAIRVCSGVMYTNIGPVAMPAYDTLTNFGVSIDTVPKGFTSDSIVRVTMRFMPSPAKPNGDTIRLVPDGGNRLWRLNTGVQDTTISESQAFQIFVTFRDTNPNRIQAARNLRSLNLRSLQDSIFCRIPKDSVNTTFTSSLAGETSSTGIITLVFPDTTMIRQNFTYVDTTFNPDSRYNQVPFVLFAGRINGVNARQVTTGDSADQQWRAAGGDSLIYFAIRIFSATAGDPAADSVTAVVAFLSDSGRPIVLTRGSGYANADSSSPAVPLGDRIWHWSASVDSPLLGPNNSDTFTVMVYVMDTIPSGSRLRAEIFSDSIQTLYQTDSKPGGVADRVLGNRTVTLIKPSLSINVDNLGDTTVSPFRQLNDSTVAMSGKFTATQVPTDSIITFGVQLSGLQVTRGESYTVKITFESSQFQPTRESTMTLMNFNSLLPTYQCTGLVPVDTACSFTIRVVANDTTINYIGESIALRIPKDSVVTFYAQGAVGNLYSNRVIRFNYIDTLTVTDSALGDTSIHPDSRQRMVPFVAQVVTFQGQTSTVDAGGALRRDTFRYADFRFTGSASAGLVNGVNDTIVAVWAQVSTLTFPETRALVRRDSATYRLTLDTVMSAASNSVTCTITVNVLETVALNSTLRSEVLGAAYARAGDTGTGIETGARTVFSAGKLTSTVSGRTVTFAKPSFQIEVNNLGDTTVSPFRGQNDSTVILSGRFAAVGFNPSLGTFTDTLAAFTVELVGSAAFRGESVAVWMQTSGGGQDTNFPMTLVTPNVSNCTFTLPRAIRIDTEQKFFVRVVVRDVFANTALSNDTALSLMGEKILRSQIDTSSSNLLTGVASLLSCSRIVNFNFVDTVLVADSVLPNITVHPDSRQGQNPFIAGAFTITGQTSASLATDTLQRIAIRFSGTATQGGDSVRAAWVLVSLPGGAAGWDSLALTRQTETTWVRAGMDSQLTPAFNSVRCTVVVLVFDTTQLNTTFRLNIDPDSVHTYYTNRPTSVYTAARIVTFGIPTVALPMDTLPSQAWVHPLFVMRDSPNYMRTRFQETNPIMIMRGTFDGSFSSSPNIAVTGDTLKKFTICFTGGAIGFIDTVDLVLEGNRVAHLTQVTNALGQETWAAENMDSGFTAPDITAESFTVSVRVQETVPQLATLFAWVPANGVRTLYRDTGPGFAVTSNCTYTYRRDSFFIYTEPRNPAISSIIQRGDTKAIMWFVPKADFETAVIRQLTIRINGSAGKAASFDTVLLFRDFNRNRQFESTFIDPQSINRVDTLIGTFVSGGATVDTWTLQLYAPWSESEVMSDTLYQRNDTAEYLIVIRVKTSDTVCTSLQASIPALGAVGPKMETGPVSAVVYDAFTVGQPDTTAPLPPANFTITSNAGSLVISWEPSPSGDTGMAGGSYVLYWDSGLGQYPTALLKTYGHVSGQLSYTISLPDSTASLVPDSQYRFVLIAYDTAGNASAATAVITAVFRSATTPAPIASATIVTPNSGDFIWFNAKDSAAINRINFVAQLKDPNTASQVTSVEFSIRRLIETGFGFSVFATAKDSSFDAVGNVYYSGLLETTTTGIRNGVASNGNDSFEVRAVAITSSGRDTYAPSISFTIVYDTSLAQYVSVFGDSRFNPNDTGTASDTAFIEQQVTTRSGSDIVAMRTPTGAFDVILRLNLGSLLSDTARLIGAAQRDGMSDTFRAQIRAAGMEIPRYWVNFKLTPGGDTSLPNAGDTFLQGAGGTITINYIDANGDDIDDSSFVNMARANVYTINGTGQVELLRNRQLDRTRHTLTGTVTHFSPFFVTSDTGISTAGLNSLIVGPNPFIPNDGNDQTGRPWVPGDKTTGILFKNLPPQARIQIYTILGEKVTEINKNELNATVNWSVLNDDGKPVASGYYLYVVTDVATGQRVTGKLAVIR